MTTLTAFNNMLKAFLDELVVVFPEQKDVATFAASFDTFVAISPRQPLDTFMAAMSPHAQLLMAKDPALFGQLQFPGIDFRAMWTSEGVTDVTKTAIWQYLQSLFLLGTTIQSLPPELLQSIETVAHDCAEKLQGGDMDFGTMASALMGGLGPLADLSALAGGSHEGSLAAPPAAPRRHSSRRHPK